MVGPRQAAPEYTPAPYLLSSPLLTAPQLVSQFQDFYTTIEYVSSAPGLVFERLVASLNGIFTVALERERHQHATALEKSRDENKVLRWSNEQLKKELAELKETIISRSAPSGPEVTRGPIIGTFRTDELRPWGEFRDKTSRMISYAIPYSAPPGIPLGLSLLDIGRAREIRVDSYVSDINENRFGVHIDTCAGAQLHGAACTWLEVEANDLDLQFGRFSTLDDHARIRPQTYTNRQIDFPRRYSAPPKVVVWLTAFDISREKNWRVKTYATDITATSFRIHIDSWSDTVLYAAAATWVAYPEDKAGIFSGSFNTMDITSSPQLQHSAYAKFGDKVFSTPPRTIVAINWIDIDYRKNLRLEVNTSSVTAIGMTWHANSWGDTVMYGAGGSYIALA